MSPEPASRAAALRARAVATLRRPSLIVAEVVAFGAGAALAASLPQQPDADEVARFAARSPTLGRIAAALGLHEIVTSPWFLALALLCFLSLVAVQAQQWPRLLRTWRMRLEPSSFARAPFRRSVPVEEARARPEPPLFAASGRPALLGSPVFHLGLLVLVTAGLVRLLTFRDVIGRAFEGDHFGTAPGAFEGERGGWLSRPLALPRSIRVEEIREERYASGALRQVTARLALGEAPGAPAEVREAAINSPLDVEDVRIYVASAHGVAAMLELVGPAGVEQLSVPLEERGGDWRGGLRNGDLELRFRAGTHPRPLEVETRVLSGGVLVTIADLAPGAEIAIPGGGRLRLAGLPFWVQLRGSRDPSKEIFFAGVAIGIAGVILMFAFNRVDTGVFVERGHLVVALRAQRFAPLYAERFERLCKEWIA